MCSSTECSTRMHFLGSWETSSVLPIRNAWVMFRRCSWVFATDVHGVRMCVPALHYTTWPFPPWVWKGSGSSLSQSSSLPSSCSCEVSFQSKWFQWEPPDSLSAQKSSTPCGSLWQFLREEFLDNKSRTYPSSSLSLVIST